MHCLASTGILTGFVGNADSTTLKDISEHVKHARQGFGNLHVCLCVCNWRDALWEILGRHKRSFGFPPISSWEQLKLKGVAQQHPESKRGSCLSLSLMIFPSCLPCLCSLPCFACPSLQDEAFWRLCSSWNNVRLSSAVSQPGRSQVQEDLGLSSKPLPKC